MPSASSMAKSCHWGSTSGAGALRRMRSVRLAGRGGAHQCPPARRCAGRPSPGRVAGAMLMRLPSLADEGGARHAGLTIDQHAAGVAGARVAHEGLAEVGRERLANLLQAHSRLMPFGLDEFEFVLGSAFIGDRPG